MNNLAKQKVIILSTGGTIEKTYDEMEGVLNNRETIIKEKIIDKLRLPYTQVEIRSVLAKDSLDLTDEDRAFICSSIKTLASQNIPIVVLHGTDTMDQTLKFCSKHFPDIPVPVVFTGAMKPLGFEDSDAIQNVIEAITASKLLRAGYYLSFHNKIFRGHQIKKNKALKTFQYADLD